MKYDFDSVINRRNTNCMKWDGIELLRQLGIADKFNEDTISIFTADMDFQSPKPVVDAVMKVACRGVYGYSYLPTEHSYYDAIINWFSQYGWMIEKEEICAVQGTMNAIRNAIKCFTMPGDGVIIFSPAYSAFANAIEEAERKVVRCPLIYREDLDTEIDFETFEKLASENKNSALIFCNPQNPTGRIWKRNELAEVVRICEKYQLLLISDEVHCDLTRVGLQYNPMGIEAKNHKQTIIITTPNKTFNIAGFNTCNAIIHDEEIRETFRAMHKFSIPSQFGIAACEAAYREGKEWLEQLKHYLDGTMDWAFDYMKNYMPKVQCHRPDATYCLWMDFSRYGYDEKELSRRIMDEANVILENGSMFDPTRGEGFMRVCIPSSRSLIQEAFYRLADAL